MPDTLTQQPIEQQAPPIPGFRLNSKKLVARMEALKKEPTEGMRTFMQAHPEYKEYNCAFLAAYCGLSESTLKKLKQGQIADPRASTFWMLWHAYRIYPRDILDMPPEHAHDAAGSVQSADVAHAIKGKDERIKELREALDKSEEHRQALREKLLAESIARSSAETAAKHRKRVITILGIVAAVMLLVLIYLLFDATHRSWGIFR